MARMIKRWTHDVASMLAQQLLNDAKVIRRCGRCDTWEPVDLAKLVEKKNPLFSLVGRNPPCEACGTPQTFHVSCGPNAVVLPLGGDRDDPNVMRLHRAWQRHHRFLFPLDPEDWLW